MNAREKNEYRDESGARRRRLSRFARRLLAEWKRLALPVADARVLVAVSGGADSTALLLVLDELLKTRRLALGLRVAHLEHGLRGARGEEDARWVEGLAAELGYDFELGQAAVGERVRERRDNLEQAARRARYAFLSDAARRAGARMILTAHTLDDQAETVLLSLLRGSGAEGLSGISPVRAFDSSLGTFESSLRALDSSPSAFDSSARAFDASARVQDSGDELLRLVRPLVGWARRAETERFCLERGVEARVDEMNADERFARVRVRRTLVPLLETFNPRAVEAIGRAAGLLRDDAAALETEAAKLLEEASGREERQKVKGKRQKGAGAGALEDGRIGDGSEDGGEDGGEDGSVGDGSVGDESVGDGKMMGGGAELLSASALSASASSLCVEVLAGAEVGVRRRALRQWIAWGRGDLRRVELAHVLGVERLLEGVRGGRVAELPGGGRVVRRRGRLWLEFETSGRALK